MTYYAFIDELTDGINSLSPRSKASIFWIFGSALARPLNLRGDWANWFLEASDLGRRFSVAGEVGERTQAVWAGAQAPTGDGASQLMNSAIICLSTPLGIALDTSLAVGAYAEHAFFPIVHRASLDLFEDVAFPDDEDLDVVFGQPVVQAAVDYSRRLIGIMAESPVVDDSQLELLLDGSGVFTDGVDASVD